MIGRLRRVVARLRRRPEPATVDGLTPDIPRPDRFRFQDLLAEASAGIGARPTRLIMTTLGTVLGIGSLVVTIGFAQTAAGQIAKQFDAVAATQVTIAPATARTGGGATVVTARLPWDAPERVERLAGVQRAGLVAEIDATGLEVTAVPVNDPSQAAALPPPLLAGTAGLLDAVRGTVVTGRFFDAGHDARGDRVAVLGAAAATQLGITRVDRQPSIFIGGVAYSVIGIIDGVQRRQDLLNAVLLPMGAARADFGVRAPTELQVFIDIGAGPLVAEQAPIALDPNDPASFDVAAPSGRSDLSQNVQADVNLIFIVLGVIALLAGGLGIANVTMLSVLERTGEIGLRRALGSTRRQIAGQFVVESAIIGLLGGLIGSALGVLAVIAVAVIQQWTPIVDPVLAVVASLLGAVVGLLAGLYPSLRASAIEPISALRG